MSPFKSDDAPPPKSERRIRPATERQPIDPQIVVALLKDARDSARRADCSGTLKKIRSALKTAESAQRYMIHRLSALIL